MLAATSCEEKIDPATPQTNPQEAILTGSDVVSEPAGVLSTKQLTLQNYANGGSVPVMALVSTENMPEGATVSYKVQLSADETFARTVTLDASTSEDGVYSVDAEKWNEAHIYLFGKSPKVKAAYYRVPVYVNLDGSDFRLKSLDYYAAQGIIEETCMDMGFTISDAYYFLSDGTSWSLGDFETMDKYKFDHSDADVYDDPVFTFNFEVSDAVAANGCYWKICSQEGMEINDWATGIYGPEVNGDDNFDGVLVDTDAQAGVIFEAGKYKITINMEEMTYSIEQVLQPEVLYTPGGANGWSQTASAYMKFDADKRFYYALMPVDAAGFKVCEAPNWDNNDLNWGVPADNVGQLAAPLMSGNDAQNISAPEAGLYWFVVNYNENYVLTDYVLTKMETVGLIGSFAASGWGSDVLMTSADNGATWTGTVALAAGDQFKFRFNGNWDYNYGGTADNLVFNGDNLSVEEAGNYEITLYLQPGTPKATIVKK